jgi:hypothetical protein
MTVSYEIHPVAWNVYPWQLVHYLIDLGDDDASLESGRFDDGGGVLRVRTHVQIALTVGVTGHGQRNMGREVDEVLISP